MKNWLVIVMIFLANQGISYAQAVENPYTSSIDSVQQLLTTQPKEDTIQVKRLYDLAILCFYDLQYERGLIAAKQARHLSKKLDYPKGEGLYLNTMFVFQQGYISFYYYVDKIWFYATIKEKEETNKLQDFAPNKRAPEKENTQLFESLKYFEKVKDKETMANILAAISTRYELLKINNESLLYTDRAIKLFNEIGQKVPAFSLLLSKNTLLEQMGQLDEAKATEMEARKIIEQSVTIKETAFLTFLMSNKYFNENKTALSFEYGRKADKALEQMGDKVLRASILLRLGLNYNIVSMNIQSVEYLKKSAELQKESPSKFSEGLERIYNKIAFTLIEMKEYDEAKIYIAKAKIIIDTLGDSYAKNIDLAQHYDAIGQVLMGEGKYQEALPNFFQALSVADTFQLDFYTMYFNYYIAECYQKLGNLKESIKYGTKSYDKAITATNSDGIKVTIKSSLLLSEVYDQLGQPLEVYKYLKTYAKIKKEIEKEDAANRLANLEIQGIIAKTEKEKNQSEKARLLKEQENQNQRWWLISIAGALFTAVVLMIVLYRNNRQKQKANNLLHQQKQEIDFQRDKAEKALAELKSTQAQLIQSEKMASLGELTAGIAHEIQNPLNFVNNFSEVSNELLEEIEEERVKNKESRDETLIGEILRDIKENLSKITLHGKRADAIVKGMLEHSKRGSGQKEPTDLNALADDFLRMTYQSFVAKDPNFKVELQTNLDPDLPKVSVIPQDIGKVLLNLYSNALYAVSSVENPVVIVSTSPLESLSLDIRRGGGVKISIKDNGNGIPDSIKDKIFQPFFTTKPTGSGTGLGLSLSYEIVKAHGGELGMETKENEGTEFIIILNK